MDSYELVLGLPHTNHLGLAEHLLMMHAGHLQWTSIARAIGKPLSQLRTSAGGEVYATFFFIDLRFPPGRSNADYQLDDPLTFLVYLRAFKGLAIEGRIVFDHKADLPQVAPADRPDASAWMAERPSIHFANIFITPEGGNSRLRVAAPVNADFSRLPPLPDEENPYHITKRAAQSRDLGFLDSRWAPHAAPVDVRYAVDPDRDSNGAGLVYFANYIAFLDRAEREALAQGAAPDLAAARPSRAIRGRRVGYYGNVPIDGALRLRVQFLHHPDRAGLFGVRSAVFREADDELICLSEAVKQIDAR